MQIHIYIYIMNWYEKYVDKYDSGMNHEINVGIQNEPPQDAP